MGHGSNMEARMLEGCSNCEVKEDLHNLTDLGTYAKPYWLCNRCLLLHIKDRLDIMERKLSNDRTNPGC